MQTHKRAKPYVHIYLKLHLGTIILKNALRVNRSRVARLIECNVVVFLKSFFRNHYVIFFEIFGDHIFR